MSAEFLLQRFFTELETNKDFLFSVRLSSLVKVSFLSSDSRTPDLFDIFAAALQMIKLLTLRGLSNQQASLLPDTVNHSV